MRNGDFSEVAAAYSSFRLYNPYTGSAGGVGREQFPNYTIPGNLISPQAKDVFPYYPLPNTTKDLNSNQIADDYNYLRTQYQHRDNYDLKLTYQRTQSHSIWAKFSMLDNEGTGDNFILGFENPSLGDTRIYVGGIGHTWTLSPTLVLDGNFGYLQIEPDGDRPRLRHQLQHRARDPGRQRRLRALHRPAHLRQHLLHRRHAELDAALPHGEELDVQHGHHQGPAQARDPRRLRLRPPRAEPLPGRVRPLRPEGRLRLQRQHDRLARLHVAGLEQLRRLPARASQLLLEGLPGDPDDRAREPVRVLRPRPLERHREADPQPRPAHGVLPADDARGQRHRAAGPQHLDAAHGRPRRRARGRRASTSRRCTSPRAWAPCTA